MKTMKKFNDILKEIAEKHNTIKNIEKKTKELQRTYLDIVDLKERHEQKKAVVNELVRLEEKKEDLQISIKILKSNAKIALFNEVMPTALEVLTKYKGKPYGPKTSEKIRNEIKEKTNCAFYIKTEMYNIIPLGFLRNTYNIDCCAKYIDGKQKKLLEKNKIQVLDFNDLRLFNDSNEYIDDIPQRIKEMKRLYKKAYEKQQELDSVCKEFNKLTVGSMKNLYIYEHIFQNMEV